MESILTILLGGVLLAAALLGGALAVPHPWGIVPTAVVIAGWTAVCCFLAVTQLEMLGMLVTAIVAIFTAVRLGEGAVDEMTLYTSKVVAQWLCLTERRVRQLRDEGVIVEARPGLYELQPTVARYITYIGGAGKETLTNERMMLTRAKREAAEMENDLRRGEVHRTADIERGIQSMFLNIRSRFLALPAKLSPTLSTMGGDQTGIFDELKGAIEEILEEMSDYRVAFAAEDGEDDGEAEKETPM